MDTFLWERLTVEFPNLHKWWCKTFWVFCESLIDFFAREYDKLSDIVQNGRDYLYLYGPVRSGINKTPNFKNQVASEFGGVLF